jgi:hypothetical protein
MNEIVNLVSKKTGLNPAMAQVAVKLVIDYLKKKLPPAVGKQIDFFLANDEKVASAGKMVGGLLSAAGKGKKKK